MHTRYKKSLGQPRSHVVIKPVSELHNKYRFLVISRNWRFWDFWYVITDTLQSLAPLKNLLQLVTGWPILFHKMIWLKELLTKWIVKIKQMTIPVNRLEKIDIRIAEMQKNVRTTSTLPRSHKTFHHQGWFWCPCDVLIKGCYYK